MEAWGDAPGGPGDRRILDAMTAILRLEADAQATLQLMPGLASLLSRLRAEPGVRVAVVTRNTPDAVAAFLKLLRTECPELCDFTFDDIITRHHCHVKPDYRLLRDLAQRWGLPEAQLLMVGDSGEDVECGNAAGTATCLLAGGGNETIAGGTAPLPGGVPSFVVSGLPELEDRLARGAGACPPGHGRPPPPQPWDPSIGNAAGRRGGGGPRAPGGKVADESSVQAAVALAALASTDGKLEDSLEQGAPPPGVCFLDDLRGRGFLTTADASFPAMGRAAGGMAASPSTKGDRVLHVGCGAGALTKILASQGLATVGADVDPSAAIARGLQAVACVGPILSEGSLASATTPDAPFGGGSYDVVLVHAVSREIDAPIDPIVVALLVEGWSEIACSLVPGGRAAIEVSVSSREQKWALMTGIWAAGLRVAYASRLVGPGGTRVLRLCAVKPLV